jgi:tRNA (guanine37-N1)-methyltransferase
MRVDVFTIFPELLEGFCSGALLGRARTSGVLDLRLYDLRDATTDARRSVDDAPFGGGAGMVLTPGPVFASVERADPPRPLYLLGPRGRRFDQSMAEELAGLRSSASGGFSLLCGRYEGVDERVADHLVDGELSIGDYVLAGGEAAAVVVIEAVSRLLPGVMGNEASASDESFTSGLLEYPHYTRPAAFRGWEVPEVLRNGDHARIEGWRRAMALHRTIVERPDLISARGGLSEEEQRLLEREDLAADGADRPPGPPGAVGPAPGGPSDP